MTASRDLCIMACAFCRDPVFLRWLDSLCAAYGKPCGFNETGAKVFILQVCGVESRSDLDTDPEAARRFHEIVRLPFLAWRASQTTDPSSP